MRIHTYREAYVNIFTGVFSGLLHHGRLAEWSERSLSKHDTGLRILQRTLIGQAGDSGVIVPGATNQ